MMKNYTALLLLLGALSGALAASNVTAPMDDYVRQSQRQYDARLKQMEDELAAFRKTYAKQLESINVDTEQLQLKLEETSARLAPMELIDQWHKQCVQNYSATIPTIYTVRTALTSCKVAAENQINNVLSSATSNYNSLKSYYNNNLQTMLKNCEKQHPTSQVNYTNCVISAIDTTNTYTMNMQKSFNTNMQAAECTADTRVKTAWECAFNTVYSTSSTLGTSLRLIDDCIANRLACASVSCSSRCSNKMALNFASEDFNNSTIRNPFQGLNSQIGCMEVLFAPKLY
ncbi:CG42807 [Drosophila busckii]|uniref:CG42807 n=1 Tax=Drosophila busckii TaxID=30019 RepID=A0A0M4E6J4_DROBS|nr:uncharacterized protein LOC108595137 [Drosophila busckii]ALC42128.1 CG42807 [Drosophila busckii]